MNTTVTCNHPGCDWIATKPGKESAEKSLHMHVTMKHGKGAAANRAVKAEKKQLVEAGKKVLNPDRAARREYQRKWAAGKVGKKNRRPDTAPLVIAFCPGCGCNIAAHNTAALMMRGGQ
jgi:hypothetical protein